MSLSNNVKNGKPETGLLLINSVGYPVLSKGIILAIFISVGNSPDDMDIFNTCIKGMIKELAAYFTTVAEIKSYPGLLVISSLILSIVEAAEAGILCADYKYCTYPYPMLTWVWLRFAINSAPCAKKPRIHSNTPWIHGDKRTKGDFL